MRNISNMHFVNEDNVGQFNERSTEMLTILNNFIHDVSSGKRTEEELYNDFKDKDVMLLLPVRLDSIKYVYRGRFVDDKKENIYCPQTFSYIPEIVENKEKIKRGRMNLSGQSLFYASVSPETNFKEIRLDVTKGNIVYVGRWEIVDPKELRFFPLIKDAIDRLSNQPYMSETKALLAQFYNTMENPYEESDKNAYLVTAIIADKILKTKIKDVNIPYVVSGEIYYDGIFYPSVQAKSDKEYNLALKPEVVDKYLRLNYVVKGIVNEDLHSITTSEIGYNHNGKIDWYRIEIEKNSIKYKRCVIKSKDNFAVMCNEVLRQFWW